MKKLNLGCGNDIRANYINADIIKLNGVDIVFDINQIPFPLDDHEFEEVLCLDILEHINLSNSMSEIYRILTPNGKLVLRVPHYTSRNNFLDPTHINRFSIDTFDYFIKSHSRNYYYTYSFSNIYSKKITFGGIYKLFEKLVNLNDRTRKIYEIYFGYIFPALNIEIIIIK